LSLWESSKAVLLIEHTKTADLEFMTEAAIEQVRRRLQSYPQLCCWGRTDQSGQSGFFCADVADDSHAYAAAPRRNHPPCGKCHGSVAAGAALFCPTAAMVAPA